MRFASRRGGAPARAVPEQAARLDPYATLGLTPLATLALARELYWVQVERLREASPPDFERRLEQLNDALTVISEERQRAQHARGRPPEFVAVRHGPDQPRRLRAGSIVALLVLTVMGAIFSSLQAGPLTTAGVVTTGMLMVVVVMALPRRTSAGVNRSFATLRLTPDAGMREVNLAYEILGQELLSRVRHDHRALAGLEQLDRAHAVALQAIAARDQAEHDTTDGGHRSGRRVVGRLLFGALRLVLSLLGSVALLVAQYAMQILGIAFSLLGGGLRSGKGRLASATRRDPGLDLAEVSADVSRRLAIGARLARPAAEPADEPEPIADGSRPHAAPRERVLRAALVLETENGNRRIPIPTAPLTIGSSPDCDLVLPGSLGLDREHAHVWQRDGALLIHVLARYPAACLVNDQPMTWASLEDGDVILLGDALFSVRVA